MRKKPYYLVGLAAMLVSFVAVAATVVPVEVEQPGTQPEKSGTWRAQANAATATAATTPASSRPTPGRAA